MKKTVLLPLTAITIMACSSEKKETTQEPQVLKANLIFDCKSLVGEGPIWNEQEQRLYWIDIDGKKLHVLDPVSRQQENIDLPQKPGTIVFTDSNTVVLALADGVYDFDKKTQALTKRHALPDTAPDMRFNDGKVGPDGKLWVGTMRSDCAPNVANLYRLDSDGFKTMIDSVAVSNGIVWSADGKTMFYIDSPTRQVVAYDFDLANSSISNKRVVVQLDSTMGTPDGIAIDEHDNLWFAVWGSAVVLHYDSKTGKKLSEVQVPAANVTACAFGGKNLDSLYITSASLWVDSAKQNAYPYHGGLFVVAPGVKGQLHHRMRTKK